MNTRKITMSAILLLLAVFSSIGLQFIGAQPIGVCYGANGNNLPSKQDVVNFYKSKRISKMRVYDPDEATLQALRGSNIELILGVPNDKLQSLKNLNDATNWVNQYVKPYSNNVKFKYIAVGNEVRLDEAAASFVLPAMQSIQKAISAANLQGQIKVSTAIDTTLIQNSDPPNKATFTTPATSFMKPIITFLNNHGSPLLANIYPYFSHVNDQQNVPLSYALFNKQGKNDAGYQNLFDALLDSVYAALEKTGGRNIRIVVSESGWPSSSGVAATVGNAGTYYKNLVKHVKRGGTPMRPNGPIETYLFAMFDENLKKREETEKHFGLFNPNKSPKYQITFN